MTDDRALTAIISAANLPGAVALISDRDGTRYARSFGQANALTGAAMAVDTVCQWASMTKAITSVAALQLVAAGKLDLDAPAARWLPELDDVQVLAGYAADGSARLRPPARAITLRQLLTHSAGFGYPFVQGEMARWAMLNPALPGSRASIRLPLLFDPGADWAYGVATDWVGLLVEVASGTTLGSYLARHIFATLGMTTTAFRAAHQMPATAAAVHARLPVGGFLPVPIHIGGGEFDGGGGGLSGTAEDYARFLRMVLNAGRAADGSEVLPPAMAALLVTNQVGPLRAGRMPSAMADLASPFDLFPDQHCGWSLAGLINPQPGPHGRSAGSLAWAGIFNSYYWADPAKGLAGVFLTQLVPFADPGAVAAFAAFERFAYGHD
jgi:CubicO group peptidase (beta-lactamase class C family)